MNELIKLWIRQLGDPTLARLRQEVDRYTNVRCACEDGKCTYCRDVRDFYSGLDVLIEAKEIIKVGNYYMSAEIDGRTIHARRKRWAVTSTATWK